MSSALASERSAPPPPATLGAWDLTDDDITVAGPSPVSALRARFHTLVEGFTQLTGEIGDQLTALERREWRWHTLQEEAEKNMSAVETRVNMNVGGRMFATAKNNLLRWEGTYFHALLGSGNWYPGDDGSYFIDRDPDLFSQIMVSFRTGKPVDLASLHEDSIQRMREEVDYFQIPYLGRDGFRIDMDHDWDSLHWDSERCSANLALSEDGCTLTKIGGGNGWNAAAFTLTPDIPCFRVRIRSTSCNIMVGYVRSEVKSTSAPNYNRSGWFIQCGLGNLYSGFGDSGRAYRAALRQGDLLEVYFDRLAEEISFAVNGANHGVAFSGVRAGEGALLPCVECYNLGASVTLEGPGAVPLLATSMSSTTMAV